MRIWYSLGMILVLSLFSLFTFICLSLGEVIFREGIFSKAEIFKGFPPSRP